MTRIAITGACGRMGRVIAGLVKDRADCTIIAGIDKLGEQYDEFPVYTKVFDMPEKPDVIIDFSHPSALPDLLSYGKMNNVPGSTSWWSLRARLLRYSAVSSILKSLRSTTIRRRTRLPALQ